MQPEARRDGRTLALAAARLNATRAPVDDANLSHDVRDSADLVAHVHHSVLPALPQECSRRNCDGGTPFPVSRERAPAAW